MKTTIEIADDLFHQVRDLAHKENTTFRALTEEGIRLMLNQKSKPKKKWKWKPHIVSGQGLTDEFKNASWSKIRDAIYEGRGA
jgi:hypothetical protein